MRQVKDNLIIFTGVCARRAISSGVPLYIGKTMESDWVSRIEAARSIGDTSGLVSGMYSAFQKEVKRQKEVSGFSQTVRECMDYVRMNYTQPLTTEEIARHCGYAEYYLTRKFTKETGVKLNDFIRSVRLSAAKVMLITTKKDIQRISEELQFGSRSYFDKVFRREIGISPKQFRDSLGQTERTEVT